MITFYSSRDKQKIEISRMENEHLINAYDYFRKKRYEWQVGKKNDGKDILKLSLLISSLRNEIDKRRLFEF